MSGLLDFAFGRKVLKRVADDQAKPVQPKPEPMTGYVEQQVAQQERIRKQREAAEKAKAPRDVTKYGKR